MKEPAKIRKFGGSLGVILPKHIVESAAIKEGDNIFITSSPEGIHISPYDPDFQEALEDAREFMRTHRDTFKALSK